MGRVIVVLAFSLLGFFGGASYANEIDHSDCFAFDDNSKTIVQYQCKENRNVIIPDSIRGIKVIAIGDEVFAHLKLTSVTLPIGEQVQIERPMLPLFSSVSIYNGFEKLNLGVGQKSGVYQWDGNFWFSATATKNPPILEE